MKRRMLLLTMLAVVLLFASGVASYVLPYWFAKALPQSELLINDVTLLNPVSVARVLAPQQEAELIESVTRSRGAISIGGGRFSQGGQTAAPDSLHIDMRRYNQVVAFDAEHKQITVQAGIRWRDLQRYIDPHNLAVKIMQSYADFTVGGSLSVNAHGRYVGEGPLINSVLAIKLLLADGSVVWASPTQQAALFYAAIGGYGGVGIILEAQLQLVDNVKVQRQSTALPLYAYRQYFQQQIRHNPKVVFHNAVLYPPYYNEVSAVSWWQSDSPVTVAERIHDDTQHYWWQPALTDFVADYAAGKWLRQHVLDPLLLRQSAVHWRNYEASYDVRSLEPHSRVKHTYGLREYFVPVAALEPFAAEMAQILQTQQANVLNVSIRHALADSGSLLAWAPQEMFAFVIYYRQGTDSAAQQQTDRWSQQLIDAAIKHGGSYYLPYQLSGSVEQFHQAYPQAERFFQLKQQYDPDSRFCSLFWVKYYPQCASGAASQSTPVSALPVNPAAGYPSAGYGHEMLVR